MGAWLNHDDYIERRLKLDYSIQLRRLGDAETRLEVYENTLSLNIELYFGRYPDTDPAYTIAQDNYTTLDSLSRRVDNLHLDIEACIGHLEHAHENYLRSIDPAYSFNFWAKYGTIALNDGKEIIDDFRDLTSLCHNISEYSQGHAASINTWLIEIEHLELDSLEYIPEELPTIREFQEYIRETAHYLKEEQLIYKNKMNSQIDILITRILEGAL